MKKNGSPYASMRRFWRRVRLRAAIPYLVTGGLLVVAIAVLGREIGKHMDAIESTIDRAGPWGVLVFIVLCVVLTSFFVPGTVLSIVAGALFGLAEGTMAVVAGAFAAALVQYGVSRLLLKDRIEHVLAAKPSLLAIQRAVRRQELRLQTLLRLTPLNPATLNYTLGAAGVRLPGFLIACIAMVPGLFMEVYFGHAGKHIAGMAGRGDRSAATHDAVVIGGLIVCILVMLAVARVARNAVREAVADVDAGAAQKTRGDA